MPTVNVNNGDTIRTPTTITGTTDSDTIEVTIFNSAGVAVFNGKATVVGAAWSISIPAIAPAFTGGKLRVKDGSGNEITIDVNVS